MKTRIIVYCMVLIGVCIFTCARMASDPERQVRAQISKIERSLENRREANELSAVRYTIEGTWTAPRHGFSSPSQSEGEFPPEDVVKDYSAEVLIDVSTGHFQLHKDSHGFLSSSNNGTRIRNNKLSMDWDGETVLFHRQAGDVSEVDGEVHFSTPDLRLYQGKQRAVNADFLPFFFAHGYLPQSKSLPASIGFSESMKFQGEEPVNGFDCVVLSDIEDRRQYWFAKELDYAVVKCKGPMNEVTIDYETRNGNQVVSSFRYSMYSGEEVPSRIIKAKVTGVHWDSNIAKIDNKASLKTGQLMSDRRKGYKFCIVSKNKELIPVYHLVHLWRIP